MLKYTYILLLTILFHFSSFSQIPEGFIAPDFTAVDLNGEEHNLYALLDEGKTVILDIYATWCEPCWDFHTSHVLTDIWEEMGPNGTDEVFIMSIESDLFTTLDDIYGTGANTQGNWVEGTPYPMINEEEDPNGADRIADDYFVLAYPTILFICPDRTVTSIAWNEVESNYESIIQSCPSFQPENSCRLIRYEGIEGTICSEENFTPKAVFQNIGTQPITEATFSITINGEAEEINWEGNLNTYDMDEVIFSNVTTAHASIEIELLNVNNVIDETPNNNTITTAISAPPITEFDTVTIEVMTDSYGNQTYWAILDENNEIVGEGGNQVIGLDLNFENHGVWPTPSDATAYSDFQLYTTDVYLPVNGCYKLVVADYFLDGICCDYGEGYFNVISQDNQVLVEGNGIFAERSENPFALSEIVNTYEVITSDLKVYPNPIADEIFIEVNKKHSGIQAVDILDTQGIIMLSASYMDEHKNQIKLNGLSALHSGLYFVRIKMDDGRIIQRKIFKGL